MFETEAQWHARMQREIDNNDFVQAPPELQKLVELWKRLTYTVIRELEKPTPITLDTGRRLRGIQLSSGLYLSRNRIFYGPGIDGTKLYTSLSLTEVLRRVSYEQIVQDLRAAVTARLTRRSKRGQELHNFVNFLVR